MRVEHEAVVHRLISATRSTVDSFEVDHVRQTGLIDEPRQEVLAEVALDAIGSAQQPACGERADDERPRSLLALVDVEPAKDGHQIGRAVLDAVGETKLARGQIDTAAARPQRFHEV
jgi:hypothetical protein